jgi:5-methylcytosine-specific restriction enzyme B
MSRVPGSESLYVVSDALRDRCLARDDSLFAPGQPIWTEAAAEQVAAAVAQDDTSDRDFAAKLAGHLASLPPQAVQLGAELLYLVLLPESDTGAERKAEHVARVLSLLPAEVLVPDDVQAALARGFAHYGQGGRAHRHESLRYLARFAREWKRLPGEERTAMLEDPWEFARFVADVRSERADMQRSALLHLVFPDSFEPIVSPGVKAKIAIAFSSYVQDPEAPIDRRLADIRTALEPEHGPGFDYWQADLKGRWDQDGESSSQDAARLSQEAVEAAIRALAATKLKPASESLLRVFLAFKAIHRDDGKAPVTGQDIERVVKELFTVLPTPPDTADNKVSGTIRLRGTSGGRPDWMRNDSYRGAFQNNANRAGRVMFADEKWQGAMRDDAAARVVESLSSNDAWPPRDAVAAIALRNEVLDPGATWADLEAIARRHFGVSQDEWNAVTSPPALAVAPFGGDPWDPALLSAGLRPPGAEHAQRSERQIGELPERLAEDVERVVDALASHGRHAIVALVGVPGTSKSHVARLAARAFASDSCLRELQFSPSYTYEEFMQGPRYGDGMKVEVVPGAFLELNRRANENPDKQYVLLVEELTRADLPRVLGELLTFVEYREEADEFTTLYDRETATRIAPNVAILATYNPADRSAINVDAALVRRMRILDFPPDMALLREMLGDNGVDDQVIERLVGMFDACRAVAQERFEETMPFGHAMFSSVTAEGDLHTLWHQTIKHILVRPHEPRHELYPTIVEHYPWSTRAELSVVEADGGEPQAGSAQAAGALDGPVDEQERRTSGSAV